jgi:hypothetical protein
MNICVRFVPSLLVPRSTGRQNRYRSLSSPDISRVRGVHLHALYNAANERLAHARRVKIFEKLNKKIFGQIVIL